LAKENTDLRRENEELRDQLSETELKVETLMETVILMEKRITLLEDQLRLSTSIQDLDLSHNKSGPRAEELA
jgi:regulator of replication initiation timing